ncbi:elongation factor P--(R)-beta-lysine ligase [Dongshaea marina]|uniref:elongation factor P--(R)-beta-lysine ligase n=1 Tax=Dongshaea marina TaxID=2047966 RepID=UPI000D3E4A8A|nr:elongation factor P--(R)-beta-lysine ligase [Dongshaea marina]
MTQPSLWQPSATLTALRQRSSIIRQIRHFFEQRQVLEVETPAMSHASITDVHLHPFETLFVGPGAAMGKRLYLQTSPEFHMKRLLAAGSGCIFQLGKAFRNEECGRYHNPEFTMLEWYRIGFDQHQLMDELGELVQLVTGSEKAERMSYQEAFIRYLKVCPLEASLDELRAAGKGLGVDELLESEPCRDTILQLLFAYGVEPHIGQHRPQFIYHFPASQAALAQIGPEDSRVAERFELYFRGLELANGFHELADGKEQLARFEADNRQRQAMGLEVKPIDYHFIEALDAGFPDCSGVAVGIDRLIMLATGADSIAEVLAFDSNRA